MKKLYKVDHYTYRVIWSDEDEEFVGLCAEFPSLSWLDSTAEKALKGVRRIVAVYVKEMQAKGKPVPEPISSHNYSGRFMVRVPPEVHRQLALAAAEEHISLNRLVSAKLSSGR